MGATEKIKLIGRQKEMGELKAQLEMAKSSKGSITIVSGEPGIGKTCLVAGAGRQAEIMGFSVCKGSCLAESAQPFLPFSKALGSPFFQEQEEVSFVSAFLVDSGGLLLAKSYSEQSGQLDADIFAGMLTAVQNFVKDSFDQGGQHGGGLGRLEYGDMKILIEHGEKAFLTVVFNGAEHLYMKKLAKQALQDIESKHGDVLARWSGDAGNVQVLQEKLSKLLEAKFLVRRNLEGINLERERLRISDAVLTTLQGFADKRPVLLVLEDIHWADESSLFVLRYLARGIRSSGVCVLATMRTGENKAVESMVESMNKEGLLRAMELRSLESASVAELSASIFPRNDFSASFFDKLSERCGGNPLYLTEMLRHMAEAGSISERNGTFSIISEDIVLPDSVEELIRMRLSNLEPDAMSLAEYASCIGREFDVGIALSLTSLKDPRSALEKLQGAGIFLRSNGRAEFSHALIQDVVYKGMGQRWRQLHHRSIGEHYETAFRDRPDEALYELARHFSNSTEHVKAYDYSVRAGEKAEASYAVEQATRFYEHAVDITRKLPKGKVEPSVERDLLKRIGQMYYLRAMHERAAETLEKVLTMSQDPEEKAETHRRLSATYERKGDYASALKEIEEGEKLANDSKPERWRLLAERGWIMMRESKFDESIEMASEALEHLRKFENTEYEQTHALNALGTCNWYRGKLKEALRYYEESQSLFEKLNDLYGIGIAYNNLGLVYKDMGEMDKALEISKKSLEIREKVGDVQGIAASYANLGIIYHGLNRLDEALAHHQKCLEKCEKLGMLFGIAASYNNLGTIYKSTGDFDRALEFFRKSEVSHKALNDNLGIAGTDVNLCSVLREKGDYEEAIKHGEKAVEHASKFGFKEILVEAKVHLSDIYLAQGKFQKADETLCEAIGVASEAGMRQMAASAHIVKARLHAARGEIEEADKTFNDTISSLRELKADSDMPESQYHYGIFLLARGEKERGRAMIEDAKRTFADMTRTKWVEKCEQALEIAAG